MINKILSFMLLVMGITVFCYIWLALDYFTRGI